MSYRWQAGENFEKIEIDGADFQVSQHLYHALLAVQKACSKPKFQLWVDSICINQNDAVERANQVKIMDLIYKQAGAVITYIGELGVSPIEDAFAKLHLYALVDSVSDHLERSYAGHGGSTVTRAERTPVIATRPEDSSVIPSTMAEKDRLANSPGWKWIQRLFASSYFRRIWCFQEYVLSNMSYIIYGPFKFNGEALGHFMQHLIGATTRAGHLAQPKTKDGMCTPQLLPTSSGGYACFSHMHRMREGLRGKHGEPQTAPLPRLIDLLGMTHVFESTIGADRLYALLGLASDKGQYVDMVDYSRDTAATLIAFRKCFVANGHGIEMLCQKRSTATTLNIPSWIPVRTRICMHFASNGLS